MERYYLLFSFPAYWQGIYFPPFPSLFLSPSFSLLPEKMEGELTLYFHLTGLAENSDGFL